jgi:ATP-dependent DNA ligase
VLAFIPPQISSSAAEPPSGGDWLHEIKHDGFRTLIHIEGGKARAFTRNGYDWSGYNEPVVKACSRLFCHSALIDGEIIVEDENGASDFDALSYAIKHDPQRLVFFAFDLLHLNGEDLRIRPLIERRAKLAELIDPCWTLRYSEHFEGDGQGFVAAAVKHGLEGTCRSGREAAIAAAPRSIGSRSRTPSKATSSCSAWSVTPKDVRLLMWHVFRPCNRS